MELTQSLDGEVAHLAVQFVEMMQRCLPHAANALYSEPLRDALEALQFRCDIVQGPGQANACCVVVLQGPWPMADWTSKETL